MPDFVSPPTGIHVPLINKIIWWFSSINRHYYVLISKSTVSTALVFFSFKKYVNFLVFLYSKYIHLIQRRQNFVSYLILIYSSWTVQENTYNNTNLSLHGDINYLFQIHRVSIVFNFFINSFFDNRYDFNSINLLRLLTFHRSNCNIFFV